jgi:catechol 2,3-dioxygenase
MAELGHVVFYVRDLARSSAFYREVVGLKQRGTIFNGRAALFSSGRSHHELLLIGIGDAPGPLAGHRLGLYHVGWKVGDTLDALREHLRRAEKFGCDIDGVSDHTVSQSLYLRDPDGNELELYVDNPDFDWRHDDSWMEAPVKPLQL